MHVMVDGSEGAMSAWGRRGVQSAPPHRQESSPQNDRMQVVSALNHWPCLSLLCLRCHNKKKRSGAVDFFCGATDKLIAVEELETCVYYARFFTPAVCEPADLELLISDQ